MPTRSTVPIPLNLPNAKSPTSLAARNNAPAPDNDMTANQVTDDQRHAISGFVDPATGRVNLLGLSPQRMVDFFAAIGEKRFRAQQVMRWIHQLGVADFNEMTNISKGLRATLAEIAEIRAPIVVHQADSADGTRKWIMEVTGGARVETVLIPDGQRGTLCVSSQVGCSLDCSFCSTGKRGFLRDLTAA